MNKRFLFLVVILSLLSLPALMAVAEISSCPSGQCPSGDEYCIYYFYGKTCPHCAETTPFIEELVAKYPNFTLHKLEIYYNSSNQDLYQDFMKRYGIERKGVPAVFISSEAYIGTSNIKENLEKRILYYLNETPVCPLHYNAEESTSHDISPSKDIKLTLGAIVTAAIIDSINPCAFAVLIFLLLYLTSMASRKRAVRIGLVYIVTVYIIYFLAGLGLLTAIQSTGMTKIVFYFAAIVSILAGLINIKDFFWYGKGISLAIPESKMPLIEKYIQKTSVPAAIVLGILVSLFELPCTGGVYLAILTLIAKNAYAFAVPYLLLYNLIFILPLVIILFAVIYGFSAEKADKLRVEKRRWLRLIMGLVMAGLGMAMLSGVF